MSMVKRAPEICAAPAGSVIAAFATRSRPLGTPAPVIVITESKMTFGNPMAGKLDVTEPAPRSNPNTYSALGSVPTFPFSVAPIWNVEPSKVAKVESTSRSGLCAPVKLRMKSFGASAPLKDLQKKFGFTAEAVYNAAKEQIAKTKAK